MTKETFLALCYNNNLEVTAREDRDVILVINKELDRFFEVIPEEIQDSTEEELLEIFTGKRLEKMLSTFSRIVGYYSNQDNWLSSKLAELKDRRAGNYSIPESTKPILSQAAAD